MSTYEFKVDKTFKQIVKHASESKEYSGAYGADPIPSLFLVKDQGAYIMSAGKPGLLKEGTDSSHIVAYAKGHNPNIGKFEDWWEGGDDFAEALPLEWFTGAIKEGAKTIMLKLSSTDVRIGFSK